jgi:hypothetical protein
MAIGGNVNFTISARDAASKVVKNVQNNIKTMAKGFAIAAAAIAAAATAAAGAIAAFGVSAVKAAMEDAAAQRILVSTLEARGLATEKNLARTDKAIAAAQKLAFTDDDVRESISIATQFTDKFSQALKIQQVAMDVARAKNISLAQATKIVGGAFNGSTGAVKKLGIELPKGARGMLAVNAVAKSFNGVAAGYSETLQGQFESFNIALAEVKEGIGGALLPALERTFKGIQPVIDDVFKTINDAVPDLKRFADSFTKNIPNLTKQAWANIKKNLPEIIQKIKDFGTGVLDLLGKAKGFIGTDGSITVGLATIGAKLGGFGGALTAVFAKGFSDLGFGPLEAGIAGAVTAGLTGSIAKAAMDVFIEAIVKKIVLAKIAEKLLPGGGVPLPTGVPAPGGTPAAIPMGFSLKDLGIIGVLGAGLTVGLTEIVPRFTKAFQDALGINQTPSRREDRGGMFGAPEGVGTADYWIDKIFGGGKLYGEMAKGAAQGITDGLAPVAASLGRDVSWTTNTTLTLDGAVVAQSVSRHLGITASTVNGTRNTGRNR